MVEGEQQGPVLVGTFFMVPRKEKGEWGLVVDSRGLNEQTEHDSYSLPLIDTILPK